eukprot:550011-Prymnesium_polylepis.1
MPVACTVTDEPFVTLVAPPTGGFSTFGTVATPQTEQHTVVSSRRRAFTSTPTIVSAVAATASTTQKRVRSTDAMAQQRRPARHKQWTCFTTGTTSRE